MDISQEIYKIAKELSEDIIPLVAILQPRRTFNELPAQQLTSHMNRMIDLTALGVSFHAIDGNPVDTAYNYLFEQALNDNAKYALCIEEDVVLPWYGGMRLLETSKQHPEAIIVGVYYIKFGGVMISQKDESSRWYPIDPTPNTGLRRNIVGCGMGCSLIPCEVLRKVKSKYPEMPLCCIVPEGCWNEPDIKQIGQDYWFYNLVKSCGVEIICDTHVQCLHMELATGKYTAHPEVNLDDYVTNIPITNPLTLKDRMRVSFDYINRMQKPKWEKEE